MEQARSLPLDVHVLSHPLAQHYLTHLRDKRTKSALFRTLTKKLSSLLAIEASYALETEVVEIETPLEKTHGRIVHDDIVVVPILRAGLGMIEPLVDLFPNVRVGYVGLQRDEQTATPSEYYAKIPKLKGKQVFITDPMLATGGSACYAIDLVKKGEPRKVVLLCIVASYEGILAVKTKHPDVAIYTVSVDRELNDRKYILPGLGDFGDRLFGTED